ncbi:MAG: hypothetical protein A3E56_03540 [Omnitrophica WOR_2 bacterium RIFCSPHIGHO2_12_FULL_64_13]|nr:MAG: hypothetical protein A3E56_03540 [Omnitrophica WOR_2 bacterium RIFCSPHIGHO2_12_FULL_64_13]
MATRTISRVAFRFLVLGLIASALWAAKATYDRSRFQREVAVLQNEQTRLSGALSEAQETLHAQTEHLTSLEQELTDLQATLTQRERQLAQLQEEHAQVLASNSSLTGRVELLEQEKAEFERKFSSVKELRTAIRLVKHQISQERWERWLAHVRQQRQEDVQRLVGGNRGYVVRQGLPTLGARASVGTKLQVRVLEPEAQ